MKLLVGLGNYPSKYDKTRHNAGFLFLDWFLDRLGGGHWSLKKDLQGSLAEVYLDGGKLLLLKPHTYMNLSGQSVQSVMKYYNIPIEDVCFVYDDIDLAFGKVRYRDVGRSGGHNGVKSLQKCLGTSEFHRLKIGVSNDFRERIPAEDFVLQDFGKEEQEQLSGIFEETAKLLGEKFFI